MIAKGQGWRSNGRSNPARPLEQALPQPCSAIEARILALEADVAALTADRRWIVSLLAEIAVELEESRRCDSPSTIQPT